MVFAHCILNENTRYLGGAFRPGVVDEVVETYVRQGIGVCQMPCPKQRAWGGVLKRWILLFYGSEGTAIHRPRGLIVPLFLDYTRKIYRRIAAHIARNIQDYARSGFEVVGKVGFGGSRSCGVDRTLDLKGSLPVLASMSIDQLHRETFNEHAIMRCLAEGQGLFTRALERELDNFTQYGPGLAFTCGVRRRFLCVGHLATTSWSQAASSHLCSSPRCCGETRCLAAT